MDVGALTRKNETMGRKHESRHRGSDGSAGPLYFRGFLGEIRGMNSETRDNYWGLIGPQRVVEPQYVTLEPPIVAPQTTPQISQPASVTSAQLSAE